MSNSNHQSEKETEARIHEILIAFAKDFQEFIRNKPRAGKDAYKIVDMHDSNGLDASTVRVVSLSDAKAEDLALDCVNMANAMLWLYYHRNQFENIEFPICEDMGVNEYIMRVQRDLDDVDSALFLPTWNRLATHIACECLPDAFEGNAEQEQANFVNTYLMLYACMRSLKDGSAIKRMVDNTDNGLEKSEIWHTTCLTVVWKTITAASKTNKQPRADITICMGALFLFAAQENLRKYAN